jgi:hypothetical protein
MSDHLRITDTTLPEPAPPLAVRMEQRVEIAMRSRGVAAEAKKIRIGTAGTQNGTFVAGIRGITTANANAVPVVIDSAGQLGTVSSSRRFKSEIKPMDQTSEAILGLNPVTFHYKSDNTGTPQFGLIAEEVAKVNPDLVVRDEDGKVMTVRYEAVNAMLLNEFLKEHRKVEEQGAMIAKQQKQIEALTATVAESERPGCPQQTCTTVSRQSLNINSNFDRLTRT